MMMSMTTPKEECVSPKMRGFFHLKRLSCLGAE